MSEIRSSPDLPRRVLIVDDSSICRRLVRAHISREDFEVHEAEDGRAGLELARLLQPDLILLDLVLPDIDGFEAVRQLKDDPETRAIPVVFLSGAASTLQRARGLDLGAVDFLCKSTDPVELRARVRAAVRAKYLRDLLEERARLDGLTGLGNRLALEERLESSWQHCRRRGGSLTVMIADLDNFKRINDAHGHAIGDEILRRTGVILRDSVRACDFVARYGGEEFVIVAPDCGLEGGVTMAERARVELSSPRGAGYRLIPGPVTTSLGVAHSIRARGTSPSELLACADRALYRAKSAGRNAVWLWDAAMDRPMPASLRLCLG